MLLEIRMEWKAESRPNQPLFKCTKVFVISWALDLTTCIVSLTIKTKTTT